MEGKISQQATAAAKRVAERLDADVLFFNGEIEPDSGHTVIKRATSRKLRPNVLLVMVTHGGDPDAAYRIARCLQLKYSGEVGVFVSGWCKSAGTLVAVAAQKLYMGDHGELGPLDIQLSKTDELWELSSGLTVDAAISTLEQTAFKMFETYLFDIKRKSGGFITFRTASEIASGLVVRLLEPIYSQIDPLKIGETGRAMKITRNYAMRLNARSRVLKSPKSIDYLISAYPSHSFVIDRDEAKVLFSSVLDPTEEMANLAQCLGNYAIFPTKINDDSTPYIAYLVDEPTKAVAVQRETSNVRNAGKSNGTPRPVRRPTPRDPGGAAARKAGDDPRRPRAPGNGASKSAGA